MRLILRKLLGGRWLGNELLHIKYCNTKDETGALARNFVLALRDAFNIRRFIETGTYMGDTLDRLHADFDRLDSIELSEQYHAQAMARFAQQPNIHLVNADSADGLKSVLRLRSGRALIWLDAHFSGGDTAKGTSNTPIESELAAILSYAERNDIILIDDLRYFWQARPGFVLQDTTLGYPSARHVAALLNSGAKKYDCFVLSDALLAIPANLRGAYRASPVLKALTDSRLGLADVSTLDQVETVISSAKESELTALKVIPDYLESQSAYGLGGHYYYWRALVALAAADYAAAQADAVLADKCGVVPPGSLLNRFPSGLNA